MIGLLDHDAAARRDAEGHDHRLSPKLRGVPIHWQSVISEWNPPHSFVDEQVRGPYRMWWHRHTFAPNGDGTLVADEVHYRVFGGTLTNRFVKRDLVLIFAYRPEALLTALDVPRGPAEVTPFLAVAGRGPMPPKSVWLTGRLPTARSP